MKKLYRKGTVHPSPSPSPSPSPTISSDPFSLSYLPAAILTLAAALSAADKEVLSYLLSADKEKPKNKKTSPNHHHQHSPCFTCYCFNCYTTYWSRWDSSPNRQLIHEIIDAFEEALLSQKNNNNISNKNNKQGLTRREKRKNRGETGDKRNNNINTNKGFDLDLDLNSIDNGNKNGSDGSVRVNPELGRPESERETGGQLGNGDDETGEKQGSVRKLVSFIGERIWGTVWG